MLYFARSCSRIKRIFASIFLTLFIVSAHAVLNLELTKGEVGALPIAVVPFNKDNDVSGIIAHDLDMSGRFKTMPPQNMPQSPHELHEVNFGTWQKTGNDSIVIGSVVPEGDKVKVSFSLLDAYKADHPVLLTRDFEVSPDKLRPLAHHISDLIYQQLLGEKGIFSTKIAYVLVRREQGRPIYRLEIADIDGYNPHPILTSSEPIMSPAWSPDSKRIAYVSFEGRRAQIYISTVATGQRQLVTRFPGINGAPAWSPDGSQLALVLSKSGSPKIYTLDLATHHLRQITAGKSIDTEPSFAPDGKWLYFTSDRAGGPQIYRVSLAEGQVSRVTYAGGYNAKATLLPNQKTLVMLHASPEGYAIATQDLQTGNVSLLNRSGRDESPSPAPNGGMVLYGTEFNGLALVSIDGQVMVQLPNRDGKIQSPAWSGFINS